MKRSNIVEQVKTMLVSTAFILLCALPANALTSQDKDKQTPRPNTQSEQNSKSTTNKVVKTFKVGVSYVNSYPLFSFVNKEDKGYGWAILEAFAKENNMKFEYVSLPMTRLQPLMDNGAIDFIFPDNPRWVAYRSNRYPNIYSGPILSAVSSTFVNKANLETKVENVKKVAIPFGYTAYTWTDSINQYNIQSIPVRDTSAGLNSLRINAVDAADVEYNIGQYIISQNPMLSGLSVSMHLPNTPVDYHLSSIKHIIVLEKLTAFVDANPELLQTLKQKYNIKEHNEVFTKP